MHLDSEHPTGKRVHAGIVEEANEMFKSTASKKERLKKHLLLALDTPVAKRTTAQDAHIGWSDGGSTAFLLVWPCI